MYSAYPSFWMLKLAVYNASVGTDTAPIWRDRMKGGLDGPEMKLIRELRKKVEAAEKSQ
jgi:hypothetical protein